MGCPVCNYSKIVTNGRKDDLVNQCQNCRIFFTTNFENETDIKKYYVKDYVRYISVNSWEKSYHRGLTFIQILRKGGLIKENLDKILEIGAGPGGVIFTVAKYFNAKPYVVELNEKFLESYIKLKLSIVNEPNENIYQTIILSHVLEHQHNLISFIQNIKKFGNSETNYLIEVPNFSNRTDELNMNHPIGFTKHSLNYLLENSFKGYKVKVYVHGLPYGKGKKYLSAIVKSKSIKYAYISELKLSLFFLSLRVLPTFLIKTFRYSGLDRKKLRLILSRSI
jgi:hypothetical protein